MVILANFFVGRAWGVGAAALLAGFVNAFICILPILDMTGVPAWAPPGLSAANRFGYDAGTIVTAVAATGFLIPQIRKDVAALIPIDPNHPVHLIALVLYTLLLGIDIAAMAFVDLLAQNSSQPPLVPLDLLENELPFLIIAFAGVGVFIRRSVRESMQRVGLVVPAWWHIALALAAAGALFVLGQQLDVLSHQLTPQIAHRVDSTTQHVFGQLDNPVGIAAVALLPGLCEELLFRGALQPRIGLVATAVLFTSIHTEYGLSLDIVTVLIAAFGLGLIRKYTNTTASCTCHVAYNLLGGISLTGMVQNAAILFEVLLVALTVYAIWTRYRTAPARS